MTIDDCIHDRLLALNHPAGIFTPDPAYDHGKPTMLVYASCHGRTLMHYLRNHDQIRSTFNLLRLETGPMLLADRSGESVFENQHIHYIFNSASVILTYNMGARMGKLAFHNVSKWFSPSAKVITFTAPNFSAFWPIADGYCGGDGVMHLLDKGTEPEDVWSRFMNGDFDPMFAHRFRIEEGRMADRDNYHDIGLAPFVRDYHRKAKMWMSASHPSYVTMAWIGTQIASKLGFDYSGIDGVLSANPETEIVGGCPETKYEFDYYKFEYPMRYQELHGGYAWYRPLFDNIVSHWRQGGLIYPAAD